MMLRLLYIALIVVLLAQVANSRVGRQAQPEAPTAPLRSLGVGAELTPTPLMVHDLNASDLTERSTTTAQLFGEGCHLAVFFASTCPYCQSMVGAWSGRTAIALGEDSARISWIAVATVDTGAATYVRTNRLPTPWYEFRSRDDRRAFGVSGWPMVMLINDGRIIDAELPWKPDEVSATGRRCTDLDANPAHSSTSP